MCDATTQDDLARRKVLSLKGYLSGAVWPLPDFPDTRLKTVPRLDGSREPHTEELERVHVAPACSFDHSASGEAKCCQAMKNNTTEPSALADFGVYRINPSVSTIRVI